MKPIKTKHQLRAEMEAEMEAFLARGGSVQNYEQGESGREANAPLPTTIESQKQTRTPVLDEIKAIEERRKTPAKAPRASRTNNGSQKKLLVDDFGEPLRWV
jgi:hypothetical protein